MIKKQYNGEELSSAVKKLGTQGGRIELSSGSIEISKTLSVDAPCICIEGEVWSYSSDPNGVFESFAGTKLRVKGKGFPAAAVGASGTARGFVMRDLGIQGDIVGMDTRNVFDFSHPERSAGICFSASRTDQGQVAKVSFCGLGTAICAAGESELDACRFEALNADGCAVGIWFSPRASYYTRITDNVIADNPYYGFIADGSDFMSDGKKKSRSIHDLEVCGNHFVRNGGAFDTATDADGIVPAAVYFKCISNSLLRDNLIDSAGVFWYYPPDAKENGERIPQKRKTPALIVDGNCNRIMNNVIANSSAESVIVRGNGNILLSNIVDSDVVIDGNGNTVTNLVFTTANAKLRIKKDAGNTVIGTEQNRIEYI